MSWGQKFAALLLAHCLLLSAGCEAPKIFKKKKPATPPPQAEAPPIAQPAPPQPAPVTPAKSEPNRPTPEAVPTSAQTEAAETETKPKPKRTHSAKKPAPAPTQAATPAGAATAPSVPAPQSPVQLSASVPHDAAMHSRMTTAQLLESTETNLKSVARALTVDEQAMVQQIQSYMSQSRSATTDGELDRAYNLALKAHLLSDELVKPR